VGSLDGHKALVTGGASGIGAAICTYFAGEGALVAVLDRRIDRARAVAREVGGVAIECDVADADAAAVAVAASDKELGGLTDLVNNAGMGLNKPLHLYTDHEWALVVGVNLTGTFPRLLESGRQHRQQRVAERGATNVG
jgi:NAD(P)-dependent dehydrogenase (short-subunit alcohol dehydrogenase family)